MLQFCHQNPPKQTDATMVCIRMTQAWHQMVQRRVMKSKKKHNLKVKIEAPTLH